MQKYLLTLPLMVVFLSSCLDTEDSEFEKQAKFEDQLISQYLEQNSITATKDNTGIYYQALESNTSGTPVEQGDLVSIRYVMKTLAGKLIDSLSMSGEVDTVVRYLHAPGAVNPTFYPEGISWGVRLMNEGEKFRFFIPSYLAFNNYSYKTLIPSEAILNVEAEVVKVESLDDLKTEEEQAIEDYIESHQLEGVSKKSTGIYYQVLEEGTGETVKTGQTVKVAYKGMFLNGDVFDETDSGKTYSFAVGYDDVIPGFVEGIKLMRKGEKGRIFIPSELAYSKVPQVIPGVIKKDYLTKLYGRDLMAPFKTLIFEVELKE